MWNTFRESTVTHTCLCGAMEPLVPQKQYFFIQRGVQLTVKAIIRSRGCSCIHASRYAQHNQWFSLGRHHIVLLACCFMVLLVSNTDFALERAACAWYYTLLAEMNALNYYLGFTILNYYFHCCFCFLHSEPLNTLKTSQFLT